MTEAAVMFNVNLQQCFHDLAHVGMVLDETAACYQCGRMFLFGDWDASARLRDMGLAWAVLTHQRAAKGGQGEGLVGGLASTRASQGQCPRTQNAF